MSDIFKKWKEKRAAKKRLKNAPPLNKPTDPVYIDTEGKEYDVSIPFGAHLVKGKGKGNVVKSK